MANLFEQWQTGGSSSYVSGSPGHRPPSSAGKYSLGSGSFGGDPSLTKSFDRSRGDGAGGSITYSEPTEAETTSHMVSIRPMDWYGAAAQAFGRGGVDIVQTCVENNIIILATADQRVFRWSLSDDKTFDEFRLEPNVPIYSVFLDPNGAHCIISLENGNNYYLYGSDKPRRLKPNSQFRIQSVGWNREEGTDISTRSFLLGTDRGDIFEAVLEGREKLFKRVYHISGHGIVGLHFETLLGISGDTRYFVVICARTSNKKAARLFQFSGGPSFEAMFAAGGAPEKLRYTEYPLAGEKNFLRVWSRHRHEKGRTLAVLTPDSIFQADMIFSDSKRETTFLANQTFVKFPRTSRRGNKENPIGLMLSEFHFFILYPSQLQVKSLRDKISGKKTMSEILAGDIFHSRKQVISRITQGVVLDIPLDNFDIIRGFTRDTAKSTFWISGRSRVFQLVLNKEDRDIWQLFLQKAKAEMDNRLYEKALSFCKHSSQRQVVLNAQADYYVKRGDHEAAAVIYAKTNQAFEEVALRFVEINQKDALKTYLTEKLKSLSPSAKTQQTMICTWLTEIYLEKFNSLQSQDIELHAQWLYDFKQFIHDNKDKLDPAITFSLMANHGRIDEMLFYAQLIEDYDRVITYHMQRRDYKLALEVLSKAPVAKVEQLYYKYSPIFVEFRPRETFKAWEEAATGLQPSKLIPAIVRYQNQHVAKKGTAETDLALEYLEQVVLKGNKDPAVHNLLLSILARYPDERRLIKFIRKKSTNQAFFDLKYALRVCTRIQRKKAMIYIYSAMGSFAEAVDWALQFDVEMAKEVASQPEDDEVRKKLWLLIAKRVIDTEGNIKEAIKILGEVDPPGLVKIEDILPFFPDFVIIDDFKNEICQSLEDYNDKIERLKAEMKDYTESAELIRQDVKSLQKRSTLVSGNKRCGICDKTVVSRSFYCFPCSHTFHANCLMDEVIPNLNSAQRKAVKDILNKLSYTTRSGASTRTSIKPAAQSQRQDKVDRVTLQNTLDSIIASECLYCGEMMIRSVFQPFISDKERTEAEEWDL